jgi:putative phage-type endonuclease
MQEVTQGSAEWKQLRCGKVTASRIKDVVAKTKTGPSALRKNYAAQLMLERASGFVQDSFVNDAMRHGTETEPLARLVYSLHTGQEVEEVSFIDHPFILRSGASPDGLVGIDGMVEIKCPNTATHIEWAIAGKVPPEHVLQMQWQMDCAGRKWCDFVSYDPRMPDGQRLFIRRLEYDAELVEDIRANVVFFDAEVDAMVSACNTIKWF